MTSRELLAAGKLAEAIAAVGQDVKAHPSDIHLRTFLFELLCFAGEYQRALKQLDVVGVQNTSAEIGVGVYRNILNAEASRSRLFSDGLKPGFLTAPPPYVQRHLDAINRLRENRADEAKSIIAEAEELRPAISGRLDGQPFSDFRDADDLLGPVLEAIVQGTYTWIPFEHIASLTVAEPKKLRDLLWVPANIECRNGPAGEVFLPVLYAGSSDHDDDRVRLGRMTDWRPVGKDGVVRGMGQRTFFVDDRERAVLELRQIEFDLLQMSGSA